MSLTESGHTGEQKRGRFRFRLRAILAAPVCLAILLYTLGSVPVSRGYSMKAVYSRLPADDQRLEAWLKEQQGVVARTVHVFRQGSTIRVSFIMEQNVRGRPSFPDLPSMCESFGYGGLESAWADDWPNGGRSWPAASTARGQTPPGVVPSAEE